MFCSFVCLYVYVMILEKRETRVPFLGDGEGVGWSTILVATDHELRYC